jgi:hypothetical protein
MRHVSEILCVALLIVLASCSGGGSTVPVVRDYTNGNSTTHNVNPQSVIALCPPDQPDCPGGGGGGSGDSGSVASTECLTYLGCTMKSVQDATVPSTFDPNSITDATSACAAIGESFDSVHKICFSLGSAGTAQFGWTFTYYTYGRCAESLTGRHPGYDYEKTPTAQYVLFCVTPGEYSQNPTEWYNVETTFLALSGSPIALGTVYAVPAGQLFDLAHPTGQSVFTRMDEKYCPANQKGGFIGLCTEGGGGVSVGLK